MLVSVIVPIYNAERYLTVCVESIIKQTYKNIEIILVDDGSTDNSLRICQDYAKKDSRILILRREHQGLVMSRKAGVEKAQGQYCMFVDSDDWIKENLLESIVTLTDNGSVDIINYNLKGVKGDTFVDWKYTIPEGIYEKKSLEDLYKIMMFDFENGRPGIIQSLWSKLFKKNILQRSIEHVDSRIVMGEDAAVVYGAMLIAEKIVITNDFFYFYRSASDSMCKKIYDNMFEQINYFQQYMSDVFSNYDKTYGLDRQLRAYMMSFIQKGIRDTYSVRLRNSYKIPEHLLRTGKKVVLYGAGDVGKSYYRQLTAMEDIDLIGWVDKRGEQCIYNFRVEYPEFLNKVEFDSILIAVKEQSMAEEIKREISEYNFDTEILWDKPLSKWWEKEIDI